jgi:prefoldin subunit 5
LRYDKLQKINLRCILKTATPIFGAGSYAAKNQACALRSLAYALNALAQAIDNLAHALHHLAQATNYVAYALHPLE